VDYYAPAPLTSLFRTVLDLLLRHAFARFLCISGYLMALLVMCDLPTLKILRYRYRYGDCCFPCKLLSSKRVGVEIFVSLVPNGQLHLQIPLSLRFSMPASSTDASSDDFFFPATCFPSNVYSIDSNSKFCSQEGVRKERWREGRREGRREGGREEETEWEREGRRRRK